MKISFPDQLPISQRREEIAELIKQHQVVIVAGETGSGKTTQIPKICLSLGYGDKGLIGHTQPRRIAARTVADRIASELNTPLGREVGYQVRFKDVSSDESRVKLMTDGVLLAEFQHDRLLKKYEAIIIDEAHERSLNIDFLLGLLKNLCKKRPELKLIITSATIDLEKFARHFATKDKPAPIIEVSGRTYPVETIYQPAGEDNTSLPEVISGTVKDIIRNEAKGRYKASGDILVFCAGERDIRDAADALRRAQLPITILPLYSRLSIAEQNRVFQKSPQRKVVLATNVAETSITVPGIAYVIDPGLARISRYSFRSKVQRLPIEAISQASANQRQGRCGRVANGVCIRLYSEQDYDQRPEFTQAEILRSNLASVILKMLRLGIRDINRFEFVDKPDKRLLNDGYKLLEELSAINQHRRLTKIGRQMSDMMVDPRYARILIAANELGCLRDVLILVAVLSIQDPRERPAEKRQAAEQHHALIQHTQSDFFSYLYLWQAILDARAELSNTKFKQHCLDNYWSIARVFEWRELVRQLAAQCKALGWKIDAWSPLTLPEPGNKKAARRSQYDQRYEHLHLALLHGLASHIANKDIDSEYMATRNRKIRLFPNSSQAKRAPKWLMAAEFLETSRLFAVTVAEIKPEWCVQAASHLCRYSYSAPHYHRRSGGVKANRKTLLYGLTLRDRESVNYAPINPVEARQVFIQQALVNAQYQPRGKVAEFVAYNQRLITDIEKVEIKTRRRNLLVNDEIIYEFYAERLPENIASRSALEQWLKQGKEEVLKLDRARLLLTEIDADEVAQFPDHFEVANKSIAIRYKFDPGSQQDGVTLVVPVSVLSPFPDYIGDWLVPGLLREKCVALIKTLPKPIRRNYAPAGDAVDRVFKRLQARNEPLHHQLAELLTRTRGVAVAGEDFSLDKLDDYYRMNYRVVDTDGSVIDEGRDLAVLKQHYADAVQQSVHASFAPERTKLEKHDVQRWDFGDLADAIEYQHEGMTVRAYPMLKTMEDGSISLLIHDQQQTAAYHTQRAVLALARKTLSETTNKQTPKYLQKELMASKQQKAGGLSSLATQLQVFKPNDEERNWWRKELIDAGLCDACFPKGLNQVRTSEEFNKTIKAGASEWVPNAMDYESDLISGLRERDRLLQQINEFDVSDINIDRRLEDIKSQLYRLFDRGFLRYTDRTQLKQYKKYLRAIEFRLEKLGKPHPEENALVVMQSRYDQAVADLREEGLELDFVYAIQPALHEFAIMLEEWRVSIFAQHLKTRMPVSEKRLAAFWDTIS
ncbi:MAG: ATP-dependent RNA helicase HrpA [Pseudomonadota bacterium]